MFTDAFSIGILLENVSSPSISGVLFYEMWHQPVNMVG